MMSLLVQKILWAILAFFLMLIFLSFVTLSFFLFRGNIYIPLFEQEENDHLEQANSLPFSSVRQGMLGSISSSLDVDIFHLQTQQGKVRFHLWIPDKELSDIRQIKLFIVGQRLGKPTQISLTDLPKNFGVLSFEEAKTQAIQKNPYTFFSWKEVGTLLFEFPQAGDYYLVVEDAFGETGTYLLLQEGREPNPRDFLNIFL